MALAVCVVGSASAAMAAGRDSTRMGAWLVGEGARAAPGSDNRCDPDKTTIETGANPELARGRITEVVSACTGVIEGGQASSHDVGVALRVRALAYFRLGQPDHAADDDTAALKTDLGREEGEGVRILQDRALAYVTLGDYGHAITDYTAVLPAPTSLGKGEALTKADIARIHQNRGVAYEKVGQTDKAVADFKAAMDLNPGNPENAEFLIDIGAVHDKRHETADAIAAYSAALALKPGEVRAWLGRAYAERDKGDRVAAEADARQALQRDPNSAPAHKLLAELMIASGHAASAATRWPLSRSA